MSLTPPGSATLRQIVEPFIEQGHYETHDVCLDALSEEATSLIEQLNELQCIENMLFTSGAREVRGYTHKRIHLEGCLLVSALIEEEPALICQEAILSWAIQHGAIPDPARNLRAHSRDDGTFACWECSRPLHEVATTSCSTCNAQQVHIALEPIAPQQQMQQRGPVR